jgi:hypothetical protein
MQQGKSQIFFFNTPPPIQRHITEILGFRRSSLPSKYLGIPLIDNALRNSSWEHLLSSFAKRLSSWTLRVLNLPSRLVLLRSVLQALPIYSFSAMAAPRSVLSIIRNLQRNFLWQGFNTGKKIALVSWDKLCRPKAQGGLGLRDPLIMNKVLTAKIWWRWLKQPQDLWAKFWRKKYTPHVAEKNLIRWDGEPWIFDLDSGQAEQTSGHPKCFLGNSEWGNGSLLAGLLAAMAHFSQNNLGGGNIPKRYSGRSDKSG